MPFRIRPATPDDVEALVRLRLANADQHVSLGPGTHRVPAAADVRHHFASRDLPDAFLLVAELSGEVVAMTETVVRAKPPAHQILPPRHAADIHTVVLPHHRGHGLGRALLAAAEEVAAEHGIDHLTAVIYAPNADAAAFYTAAGYGPHGVILAKDLNTT